LPFRNAGAREDDFLADELTDELIDGLSMLGTLRVRPRRAVQGADASDLSALGKALDVDVIVEGTLRRSVETVRISARVLTVADAVQVWARRFDHAAGDLVGANRAVLDALTEALSTGPARLAPPPPQPASSAMFSELYLRARRELRTSWDGIGDISLAVELFRQALLRSPDDPAALSGFAMARSRRYNYDGGNDEKLTEIRAVAERAVALAPHMGEPLLTLASLDYVTSEWPRAVRALRGALRLAPGLLKAHETLGYIEVEVGRLREGGLRLQNVHALDPAQPLVRHELARVGAFQGDWERAYELLSVASEKDTREQIHAVGCARIDLWSGQPRFDVVAAEDAAGKPALLLARAMGEAARGRPLAQDVEQFFLGMISRTGPRSRFRPLLWQVMTEIHASVGETSRAVHTARQAVAAHLFDRSWMTLCPALRSLRSLPEWHTLLAQVDAHTQPIRDALDEPMS
jgi:serine/threonine-protein kinase